MAGYGYQRQGSRWSLWSRDSVLSIASTNSILSVASVGSMLSIGSIGSVASVFSVGAAGSIASALSSLSRASLLSYRSDRAVQGQPTAGLTPPLILVGVSALAAVAELGRRRRVSRRA